MSRPERPTARLRSLIAGATFILVASHPATLAGQGARGTIDPTADSLISLWIDAVGGRDTYHRFQGATYTVTTVWYDTVSGRQKRSRPRYVWLKKGPQGEQSRVERWETGGLIQQGFNGRDPAWAAEDGTMLPDTSKDGREALYVARDLFYWIGLPFKLEDPGVNLAYAGLKRRPGAEWRYRPPDQRAPDDGRYHAVEVSFGVGVGEHQDVFTYYFAPGDPYPTEVTYVEEGRTNINRLLWGDTDRAGDLRYPYPVSRTSITASGKRTKALAIGDMVINPEIPQWRFERPEPPTEPGGEG
ncbi:MAG: hypothetical protein ACYSTY_10830 [Planctomycetota bacterium]|jgi:hypothetical protein